MKFILLICAVLWSSLQCINSYAIPRSDNPQRDNLLNFTIGECSELAKNTLRRHKATFEALVKELQASVDKSINLQTKLNEFVEFNSRAEKLDEKKGDAYTEELFTLFPLGIELEEKYNLDELKEANSEDRLIEQQLKKHGVIEGGLLYVLELQNISEKMTKRVQDYVDSLTEDEKKKDTKLIAWFGKFKLEDNFEKKLDEMIEFFGLFETNFAQ